MYICYIDKIYIQIEKTIQLPIRRDFFLYTFNTQLTYRRYSLLFSGLCNQFLKKKKAILVLFLNLVTSII